MAHRVSRYNISVVREATSYFNSCNRLRSTEDAKNFCREVFVDLAQDLQEQFIVVALDTQNKPIGYSVITKGTLNSSLVHPREVFRFAIAQSANSILLVHNHPSGDLTPSLDDYLVTKRLEDVAQIVGINILDHIIVGFEEQTIALSLKETRAA